MKRVLEEQKSHSVDIPLFELDRHYNKVYRLNFTDEIRRKLTELDIDCEVVFKADGYQLNCYPDKTKRKYLLELIWQDKQEIWLKIKGKRKAVNLESLPLDKIIDINEILEDYLRKRNRA